MFSILNRAMSWAVTSFGNKFCLKKRSRLIKALDNRFYVKFMQLEIGLLICLSQSMLFVNSMRYECCAGGTTCNDLPAAVDLGGGVLSPPADPEQSPGGGRGGETP